MKRVLLVAAMIVVLVLPILLTSCDGGEPELYYDGVILSLVFDDSRVVLTTPEGVVSIPMWDNVAYDFGNFVPGERYEVWVTMGSGVHCMRLERVERTDDA